MNRYLSIILFFVATGTASAQNNSTATATPTATAPAPPSTGGGGILSGVINNPLVLVAAGLLASALILYGFLKLSGYATTESVEYIE